MLPPEQAARARATASVRLAAAAPGRQAEIAALLDAVSPPAWALEWSLPWWLGERFGPAGETAALVGANVVGLVYVRLADRAAEGETLRPGAAEVMAAAGDLWAGGYRRWFAPGTAFWQLWTVYGAQWSRATAERGGPPPAWPRGPAGARAGGCDPFPGGLDAADGNLSLSDRSLAHRGAPLKVCVAAACLLAGREALIGPLAAAVDDLLAGAVLLDHVMDWREDLEAGRANAWLAYCVAARPGLGPAASVAHELALGAGGAPYYGRLDNRLARALAGGRDAGVPALAGYVCWLREAARAHRRALHVGAQAALARTVNAALAGAPGAPRSGLQS
jgi:hypothetical protein